MTSLQNHVLRGQPLPWPGIVDMHAHLGAWREFAIAGADADALVRRMDRLGVARLVCSHQAVMTAHVAFGNDEVLRAMRRHPGRILGYAACYPLAPRLGVDEIRRCLAAGMVGLKLHDCAGLAYTAPAYAPVWELADRRRLPVLLHTWGGLEALEPLFRRYRRARILLGHAGAASPESYVAAARRHPNLYLEICYSLAPRGLVEYFVRAVGARRVLFGSDTPWMDQAHQLGRVVFADITAAQQKEILVRNPARLLGA